MSFEDDLLATVERAHADRRQENQDDRDFDDGWQTCLMQVVMPVFMAASSVLATPLDGCRPRMEDAAVLLEAGRDRYSDDDQYNYTLSFEPDKKRRKVVFYSSFDPGEPADFTLDALDREFVEGKVKEFAYRLARGDS